MKITRTSLWSGVERTMELDITPEQIGNFNQGMLVQRAFENLTADEREFILTGMTAEEHAECCKAFESEETQDLSRAKQYADAHSSSKRKPL